MVSFEEVLDDLCARFLINLPWEEQNSRHRLGVQFEQAYWFYEDFYRIASPTTLPKLKMKPFSLQLYLRCPVKFPIIRDDPEGLVDEFFLYKSHVPTCGAIIVNPAGNKCLLVQGFQSRATWGFPKGKIAKDELPADCAIREVLEETGFDIRPHLRVENFLQVENKEQHIRLYIILNISEETLFEPQTRREIRDIRWHRIKDLIKGAAIDKSSGATAKYYNVSPFIPGLLSFLNGNRKIANSNSLLLNYKDDDDSRRQEPLPIKSISADPLEKLRSAVQSKLKPIIHFTLDCEALTKVYYTETSSH